MDTRLELYELVVPLAGLGIWERNIKTGGVYWNDVYRQILEVSPDAMLTLDETVQFYTEPQLIRDLVQRGIASGGPEFVEAELVTAKGNTKFVKLRLQSTFEGGVCARIYGTIEDVSTEVRLRQQSAESEQRFFQAFNHAPIGMALVSTKGEWIRANNSLCQLLGYTEQELLQRTFQELTHPDDLELDLEQMHQVIDGTINTYSMEKRYYHKDGHLLWVLLNVSVVRAEVGKPNYFVSQIKDITEDKRNVEIIREQNARLLNFAHIVSHNLRSHTGNMRMLTDLIAEETDEVEKDSLLRMLNINADNLLETLNHLNEVVKVNDNGLSGRQQLNLAAEVRRVLEILSGSMRQADANIIVQVKENITLLFHPAYLESILINLVSNSIRYRRPGHALQIKISAKQEKGKLVISVSDNGMGIDLALHGHKLFGMYKTFHGNADARGMGLFLVKNQVEAMGGTIAAESELGAGITFTIELYKN
jgi:PAS domain S-box-containing protein